MLILIDEKAPREAKARLQKEGEVIEFSTSGICYEAISGHPDIFFFQHPGGLIVAPNTPEEYIKILRERGVPFVFGEAAVGQKYPQTAHYNALYTRSGILHNSTITDNLVKQCHDRQIHCRQAYVRCNVIETGEWLITSDKGIERTLLNASLNVLYVCTQNIVLQGFKNGFLGGSCGMEQKKIYFCGSIGNLPQSDEIKSIISREGCEIIELYNGPLHDVGSILFIPPW
ncbi:MAG: hypothetical protein EA361_13900 [Bacteroidetes bacterium]|nr:MAG: hypothetical protein EA361_13900 [Bacteroidota bacterium]